jgi:hypothetical protein
VNGTQSTETSGGLIIVARQEVRYLCSDLLSMRWSTDASTGECIANLEEIWSRGAQLQVDEPIPPGASVRLLHGSGELRARVVACKYDVIGYFIELEFEDDCRWDKRKFRPKHLFDPRSMVATGSHVYRAN